MVGLSKFVFVIVVTGKRLVNGTRLEKRLFDRGAQKFCEGHCHSFDSKSLSSIDTGLSV